MFDPHSHILPGVDDGATTPEATRQMLRMAHREGIRGMMATPHFHADMDSKVFRAWKKAHQLTRTIARDISPSFKVYLGAEVFYDSRVIDLLKKGAPLTLAGTRYVLIEFPENIDLTYLLYAVRELLFAGYRPILAHIERYPVLRKEGNVAKLREAGAHMQVNASTLAGKHGLWLRNYMIKLIKKDYIFIVGTDAHGFERRRPSLLQCTGILDKKVGKDMREKLCIEHFLHMIKGEHRIEKYDHQRSHFFELPGQRNLPYAANER